MADIAELFRRIAKKEEESAGGAVSYLLVGLGNPGAQYSATRHNAGFMALDHAAQRYGVRTDRARFRSLSGEGRIAGERVLFLKPQTFMNLSGEAVGEAAKFYKIPPERVIVLSDDISLDVGRLRLRRKGSAGGHNGLKSIAEHLGSEDFPRIKIGVGQKPHPDYDLAAWVLATLDAGQLKTMQESFDGLEAGLEKLIAGDIEGAMQICNRPVQEHRGENGEQK